MKETKTQTAIQEKISELSPEKRELLGMLFENEELPDETKSENVQESLNVIEKKLKEIWQKVLGKKNISKTDNFFKLGGDSLHCIQIVVTAGKENLKFSTADLFETKSIENLAAKISTKPEIVDVSGEEKDSEKFTEADLSREDMEKLLRRI